MVKLVCLINRPADTSREEFGEWWLGHHAPLVAHLPGLRRYVISLSEPDGEGEAPYDGVAELWFDSQGDMESAFASREGEEVSREDRDCIGARLAFVTEEHVIR
jgi:uncharacterized protein (TIGR02118 family)